MKEHKCNYCYFKSLDIDKVKAHEEYLHGCYRDLVPRKPKSKKSKPVLKHKYLYGKHLPLHNNPNVKIDVEYHIWSDEIYRMYTDDLKYGDHLEIVFNNDYTIKYLDKVRSEYYAKQDSDVVTNVGSFERLIHDMS
ncbi:MAG: hypothetical protein KAH91_01055 [Thermoplasmatales archaeon]|nr:hypothetical protein [Thermoplasmatales archaeon]